MRYRTVETSGCAFSSDIASQSNPKNAQAKLNRSREPQAAPPIAASDISAAQASPTPRPLHHRPWVLVSSVNDAGKLTPILQSSSPPNSPTRLTRPTRLTNPTNPTVPTNPTERKLTRLIRPTRPYSTRCARPTNPTDPTDLTRPFSSELHRPPLLACSP